VPIPPLATRFASTGLTTASSKFCAKAQSSTLRIWKTDISGFSKRNFQPATITLLRPVLSRVGNDFSKASNSRHLWERKSLRRDLHSRHTYRKEPVQRLDRNDGQPRRQARNRANFSGLGVPLATIEMTFEGLAVVRLESPAAGCTLRGFPGIRASHTDPTASAE